MTPIYPHPLSLSLHIYIYIYIFAISCSTCNFRCRWLVQAPYQTKLIDASLLVPEEIKWVNNYHSKCREILSPLLNESEMSWLEKATEPIAAWVSFFLSFFFLFGEYNNLLLLSALTWYRWILLFGARHTGKKPFPMQTFLIIHFVQCIYLITLGKWKRNFAESSLLHPLTQI